VSSFQRALPRLFVPSVKTTCNAFLKSVRPLLTDSEYDVMASQAKSFMSSSTSWKANALLTVKSWLAPNYISDWWLKYGTW
jgi:hypothetical protein